MLNYCPCYMCCSILKFCIVLDIYFRIQFNTVSVGGQSVVWLISQHVLIELSSDKFIGVFYQLTEEQIRLMRFQRKLEEETNKPFLDLSLHETMYKLIVENNQKAVEQLRKDFKVPDRRYNTLFSWSNTILYFQVYVSICCCSDFITRLFISLIYFFHRVQTLGSNICLWIFDYSMYY